MKRLPTDRIFLSAQWKNLLMMNWKIDPSILESFVPAGTELDFFGESTFVSIVGFQFLDTRLWGFPIPFHRNFEELNLRFYVKRTDQGELKRGVAFISEIVPKWAIAATARNFYNENYVARKMGHVIKHESAGSHLEYRWTTDETANRIVARTSGHPIPLGTGSLEEFIAEHYWGYSEQRDGSTFEYRVRHEPWHIWQVDEFEFDCDVTRNYGDVFAEILSNPPDSVFVADGSPVSVSFPNRLT